MKPMYTINEVREHFNLPPLEDGEVLLWPSHILEMCGVEVEPKRILRMLRVVKEEEK